MTTLASKVPVGTNFHKLTNFLLHNKHILTVTLFLQTYEIDGEMMR